MSEIRIRQILKNRIPIMHDNKYLDFVRKYTGKIAHHFTKSFSKKIKHNDYLTYGVENNPQNPEHDDIHIRGIEDQEEAVLKIITLLIAYIQHLYKEIEELKK